MPRKKTNPAPAPAPRRSRGTATEKPGSDPRTVAVALAKKTGSPDAIRYLAGLAYDAELAAKPDAAAFLPGDAVAALAAELRIPRDKLRANVDPVYYGRNGRRNPFGVSAAKGNAALGRAIRSRVAKGGTLGRWDSLAAAASETRGRPVSVVSVKSLYAAAGGDPETKYVGRGTRAGATATRIDAAAELADVAPDAAPDAPAA